MRLYCKMLIIILLVMLNSLAIAQSESIEIDVWTPPYNNEIKRKDASYTFLEKAEKPWKICVAIPHIKDPYWLAVNYAIVTEAKKLGVRVNIYQAGGYSNLEKQRKQVSECIQSGADGLILSAVNEKGFDDLLKKYKEKNIPVVDLINWMSAEHITARVGATYWDIAYLAGRYVLDTHNSKKDIRIAWFPGPEGLGWVKAAVKGMEDAVIGTPAKIITTRFGDTGVSEQGKLVEEVLNETTDIDYIIGTTVTAEAAVKILRTRGLANKIKVIPYYYGPAIHRGISRGVFDAAASDMQGLQSRIAMDNMVRILEKKEYHKHIGAKTRLIDRNNPKDFDPLTSLPPHGFRAIFSVDKW